MTLVCEFKNIEEWKSTLDAISVLVEDAMFIVHDEGISFRGTDPAHVALLDIVIPKSSFAIFDHTNSFFGIKIDDLKSVVNTAGNNDIIRFNINDNKMEISVTGSLNMKYTLSLLNKEETNLPIPKIDFKSKISTPSQTLTKIFSNLEKITDQVSIISNPQSAEFYAKGDSGDARINIVEDETNSTFIKSDVEISANYSLEYMIKVIRSVGKTSKTVELEFDSEKPMRLNFNLPSDTKVQYYLAPRTE